MADIVTIKHERTAAQLVKLFLDLMRQCGFPGAREPGKPDHGAAMGIELFAPCARDCGVMPHCVPTSRNAFTH
jgi:hypothetical protein